MIFNSSILQNQFELYACVRVAFDWMFLDARAADSTAEICLHSLSDSSNCSYDSLDCILSTFCFLQAFKLNLSDFLDLEESHVFKEVVDLDDEMSDCRENLVDAIARQRYQIF